MIASCQKHPKFRGDKHPRTVPELRGCSSCEAVFMAEKAKRKRKARSKERGW